MKFVLLNELYEKGGAEMQTRRERDILRSHGHSVLYITLDSELPYGRQSDDINHWNFPFEASSVIKNLRYRFFANRRLKAELEHVISQFSPDYIHLNNITVDRAVSVYRAVKNYKSFQTIRDYNAVCPTSLCIKDSGEICQGFCSVGKCNSSCGKGYNGSLVSRAKRLLNRLAYIRHKHVRLACIKYFICPSKCLTDYCRRHGFETSCINNPFDFSLTDKAKTDKRAKYNGKIMLFYGLVAEHKGIFRLIDAFDIFCQKNREGVLYIAGALDGLCDEEFYSRIKQNPRIVYIGKQKYADIPDLLSKIYTVAVPSLWLENYPNTVLEGMASESLVIGSDRGGIPEMVQNPRWLFDIDDVNSIAACMERAFSLSFEEYSLLVEQNFAKVRKNNDMEAYYERIMNFTEAKFNEAAV